MLHSSVMSAFTLSGCCGINHSVMWEGWSRKHTHTELFEILTYLTQLNCKDSTLCMIAGLQLQNVVNGNSKSSVHSLPESREDLLRTLRISGEVWHP